MSAQVAWELEALLVSASAKELKPIVRPLTHHLTNPAFLLKHPWLPESCDEFAHLVDFELHSIMETQ